MGYVPSNTTSIITVNLGFVAGCSMSAGSPNVVAASAIFTPADVGRVATVIGAGAPTNSTGPYAVSGATWSGGTATLTVGSHPLTVDQRVMVSGVSPSGYDKSGAIITSVTPTTISYAVAVDPGTWGGGGIVTDGDPFDGALLMRSVTPAVPPRIIAVADSTHATLDTAASLSVSPNNNLVVYRPVSTLKDSPIQWASDLTTKATASFTILVLDWSWSPQVDQPVWIHDSGATGWSARDLFGGYISTIVLLNIPNKDWNQYTCQCVDWSGVMTRRLVGSYNSTYGSVSLKTLASKIVYDHAGSEGFVVDSTTGGTIPSASYTYSDTVSSALDDACSRSFDLPSASDAYRWYVDAWKVVRLVEQSANLAPWSISELDASDGNVLRQIKLTTTVDKRANRAYVDARQELSAVQDSQSFAGNGSSDTFNVSKPVGAKPVITLNGQAQTVGVEGIDSGFQWYWSLGSSSIRQDSTGLVTPFPIIKTQTLTVNYFGYTEAQGWFQNDAGVDAAAARGGGTGFCDIFVSLDNPVQPGTAQAVAESEAKSLSNVSFRLEIKSYRGGLDIAQSIPVYLVKLGVNETFLIDQVSLDCTDNRTLWTVRMVFGPLTGGWKLAFARLIGSSNVIGAGGSAGTGTPTSGPLPWIPNFETPVTGDPLFSAKGFGVDQLWGLTSDGSPLVELQLYGDPPPVDQSLVIQVRRALSTGVFAQVASAVVTNVISFGGSGLGVDQFNGRVLSRLANPQGDSSKLPIQDFTVDHNNATGDFTVHPDPFLAGCRVGDLFTMRTAPTAADATSYTDALYVNAYNPGLQTSKNAGNIALVIGGTGAGQVRQAVVDNTTDKVTIAPGWSVIPDATSKIVLLEANPQVGPLPSTPDANVASLVATVPVDNYRGTVVRVEVYTADSQGLTGPLETVASREIYLWGAQGTRVVASAQSQIPTDRIVKFDTTGVAVPTATTLTADVTGTTDGVISVASGADVLNGIYLQIDSEIVYVKDGGLSSSPDVERGQLGTTAATHANGASVIMGGGLAFTLLPIASQPNQGLILVKATPATYTGLASDLNYVQVTADPADELPDGASYVILSDSSSARGTFQLVAPGA